MPSGQKRAMPSKIVTNHHLLTCKLNLIILCYQHILKFFLSGFNVNSHEILLADRKL